MPDKRYYLRGFWQDEDKWERVSVETFVRAEKIAGYEGHGGPDQPVTGGFAGHGVFGRVRSEEEGQQPPLVGLEDVPGGEEEE